MFFFYGSRKKGGGGTRNNFIFRRFKGMFLGLFLLILLVFDFNNFNIPRGIRTYHHLPTSSRSAHAYRASMPKRPPDYFIDIDWYIPGWRFCNEFRVHNYNKHGRKLLKIGVKLIFCWPVQGCTTESFSLNS